MAAPSIVNRDCKQIKNPKPFLFLKLIICKYCYSTNPSNLYFGWDLFQPKKGHGKFLDIRPRNLGILRSGWQSKVGFFIDVLFFIKGRWVNEAGRMVLPLVDIYHYLLLPLSRWWFGILEHFLIIFPTPGNDPFWLIFFKWVETTN